MATSAIRLVKASARDIGAVEAIMGAAFDPRYGEAWTRGQCLGVLAMPGVRLMLARIEDNAVGFAMMRIIMDEAELLLLAVSPGARRGGIGSALLRAIIADCADADVAKLHLEVRSGNDAIRLYARHGFAKQGERHGYYRGPAGRTFDAHTYSRMLR